MPPTPDGELKFCRDLSFTNSIHHSASGQTISVSSFVSGDSQWTTLANVPPALQQELYTVMQGIYGHEANELTLDSFRLCWYVLARSFPTFPSSSLYVMPVLLSTVVSRAHHFYDL